MRYICQHCCLISGYELNGMFGIYVAFARHFVSDRSLAAICGVTVTGGLLGKYVQKCWVYMPM